MHGAAIKIIMQKKYFVRKTLLPVISSERHNIPVFKCLVLSKITVISK